MSATGRQQDGSERPQGPDGVEQLGHRDYVGGLWEELGRLQFDYLVAEGLRPEHTLLDIACGSLRAGVHFVPYLEARHYLGMDKEADLIQAGVEEELGRALVESKRPELIVSASFEFERFSRRPDYALAQSLFTHLPAPDIEACLRALRGVIREGGAFYATFFESEGTRPNPAQAHDHGYFAYPRSEMEALGARCGWRAEYVGDWKHPRDQKMVRYRPA